ncbi:MAG: penicillin-binding transpeptidase domain-containing protein [Bacteroidales bacterium]|nr:penicillin-binding transpeptidase domain-containing protein [Bacteroidales bacterium]
MASSKNDVKLDLSKAYTRYRIFLLVAFVLVVVVVLRISQIIWLRDHYWLEVYANISSKPTIVDAKRGSILSDEGLPMASYLPNYEVCLDFKVIDKNEKQRKRYQYELDSAFVANVDSFALGLSHILGNTPAYHKRYLVEAHAKLSQSCKLGKRRMSFVQWQQVRELTYFKNRKRNRFTVSVHTLSSRAHPYGNLALRTIGEIYDVKQESKSGIELGMHEYLVGHDGLKRRVKVGKDFVDSIIKPSVNGADVHTTLNIDIQDMCDQVLRQQLAKDKPIWGACLVMEVATGDIKAMVNLGRRSDGKYIEDLNRLVNNKLEPGSVFKPVAALVALDDGRISINSGYDLTGGVRIYADRAMKEHNYHSRGGYIGYRKLPFILGYSSNVGISSLIYDNYKNAPERFVAGVRRTGLLDEFHIHIPGTATAEVTDPSNKKLWSKTSLPWMSIGYESKVPPLATVAFYNGVANGGRMMRPRLVTKATRGDEVVYDNTVSVQRERMASPEAIAQLHQCLAYVVDSGLGSKAGSPYFKAAGKTGTAQVWDKTGNTNRKLVSFVGYFPADHPRYTVMVTMEGYGLQGGGTNCAPVFRQISEAIMARYIRPSIASAKDTVHTPLPYVTSGSSSSALRVLDALGLGSRQLWAASNHGHTWGGFSVVQKQLHFTPTQAVPRGSMPDVRGMGAKDALWLLERQHLKVRVQGVGVVVEQSIDPGKSYTAGSVVTLRLDYPIKAKPTTDHAAPATAIAKGDSSQVSGSPKPAVSSAPKASSSSQTVSASPKPKPSTATTKTPVTQKVKADRKPKPSEPPKSSQAQSNKPKAKNKSR